MKNSGKESAREKKNFGKRVFFEILLGEKSSEALERK
jgi:hypothetical protein